MNLLHFVATNTAGLPNPKHGRPLTQKRDNSHPNIEKNNTKTEKIALALAAISLFFSTLMVKASKLQNISISSISRSRSRRAGSEPCGASNTPEIVRRLHTDDSCGDTNIKTLNTKRKKDPNDHIIQLLLAFPQIPMNMMVCLLLRYNGNCFSIYQELSSRGWDAKTNYKFPKAENKNFAVSYYHGSCPSAATMDLIFKDQLPGSYITYYKQTTQKCLTPRESKVEKFSYFLCFKQENGTLMEAHIPNIEVPNTLVEGLSLRTPIAHKKREISCVPNLAAIINDFKSNQQNKL